MDRAVPTLTGTRLLTPLGVIVELVVKDGEAYHFVEWGPGLPARHGRMSRERWRIALAGSLQLGTPARA